MRPFLALPTMGAMKLTIPFLAACAALLVPAIGAGWNPVL